MEKYSFRGTMRRRLLVAGLVGALSLGMLGGCFGSFGLTQSIWRFNRDASNNMWVQEILFLALIIVPVYEVVAIVDAIVLNSIEFWSGDNPTRVAAADGSEVLIVKESPDTLRLERNGEVIRIRKEAGTFFAEDESGRLLSVIREADGGAIERLDETGVHRVEAWEIALAGKDPAAFMALAK